MKYLFLFLCLTLSFLSRAEFADTFVVKIYPEVINVISPQDFKPNLTVIIENKSMVKVLAKISNIENTYEKLMTIKPGKFISVDLEMKKDSLYYFTPLSPPFQSIELKVGQQAYEIPAKK